MSLKTSVLLACALLIPLSATAATPKPKAAAPAAAAPAPAKPAPIPSPVANFDARNPSSVMAIFNLAGGKATLVDKDSEAVLLNVTSVAANFMIFFASCDAQGRACKAHVVLSTLLFADDPYEHFRGQTQAWFGCIDDFRHFLRDPNGYLASAP